MHTLPVISHQVSLTQPSHPLKITTSPLCSRQPMVDRISKERRSWNMSRVKGANTAPEKMLRSLLHRAGFRFRIHAPNLPGRPDIVLPKYRTVIFVHGCFWHRHSGCLRSTMPKTRTEFWTAKFDRTIERDRRNQADLAKLSWNVIVVWECELRNCRKKILTKLTEHLRPGSC